MPYNRPYRPYPSTYPRRPNPREEDAFQRGLRAGQRRSNPYARRRYY